MIVYLLKYGDPDKIVTVEFETLSSETLRKLSVVEVKDPMIYLKGVPNMNGINDVRMGTVDRRIMCSTCGRGGHAGLITREKPKAASGG